MMSRAARAKGNVRLGVVLVAAVVLQAVFSYRISVFGLFDLPLICSIYYGFTLGRPFTSIWIGSGLGLLQDGLSGSLLGVNAFCKTLVAFLAAIAVARFNVEQPLTRLVAIFGFTIINSALSHLLMAMAYATSARLTSGIVAETLASAVFNALLGLMFFGYHDRKLKHATV